MDWGCSSNGSITGRYRSDTALDTLSNSPIETLQQCHIIKETSHIPWRIRLHERSQMHYSVHHIDFTSTRD